MSLLIATLKRYARIIFALIQTKFYKGYLKICSNMHFIFTPDTSLPVHEPCNTTEKGTIVK